MTTKVFVGNLDFNTTDNDLREAFSQVGQVKRGVIITRGRRPLGYGFVEFYSPDSALASVEKMNKTNLLDRQIKVELAKDPNDFQPRNLNIEGGGKETGPAPRRRRRGNYNDQVEDETLASNPPPVVKSSPEENFTGDAPRNPRRRRKNKKIRPPTEKVLSKTTLFVANLPFSVDDEYLKTIFAGTNAKSARVVRTRNGRSRGYGFVEFENENDQVNAMKEKNDKEVEGNNGLRKISVTISNSISTPEDTPVPNSPPATFVPPTTAYGSGPVTTTTVPHTPPTAVRTPVPDQHSAPQVPGSGNTSSPARVQATSPYPTTPVPQNRGSNPSTPNPRNASPAQPHAPNPNAPNPRNDSPAQPRGPNPSTPNPRNASPAQPHAPNPNAPNPRNDSPAQPHVPNPNPTNQIRNATNPRNDSPAQPRSPNPSTPNPRNASTGLPHT